MTEFFTTSKEFQSNTNLSHKSLNLCYEPKDLSFSNVFYLILMVFVAVASFFGNSLVIAAVFISRQLRKKVTMYFVVSLALSDLVVAMTQIPFKISLKLEREFCHGVELCYFVMMADVFGNIASILNLLLIAIDRFIAVIKPFRYSELMTSPMTKSLITLVWCMSLLWCLLGIFRWDSSLGLGIKIKENICRNTNYGYYATSFFGVYIPTLMVITCTYLKILYVAIQHIKAIEANTPHFNTHLLPNTNEKEILKEKHKSKFHRELKATKSVAFVYLAFVICWFPSCVINGIIFFNPEYFPKLKETSKTLFNFLYYIFADMLPIISTMVNPFIYSFSNKQFRTAFKQIIYKLTLQRKNFIARKTIIMSGLDTPSPVLKQPHVKVNNNENFIL